MRKEKYVARNITVTRVKYQTNKSNDINETTMVGSFSRREALEELRDKLEDDKGDILVTQVCGVMEEIIKYKVRQTAFVLMAEYDLSGPQLAKMILNSQYGKNNTPETVENEEEQPNE